MDHRCAETTCDECGAHTTTAAGGSRPGTGGGRRAALARAAAATAATADGHGGRRRGKRRRLAGERRQRAVENANVKLAVLAVGAREGELVGAGREAQPGRRRAAWRARQRDAVLQRRRGPARAVVGGAAAAAAPQPGEVGGEAVGRQQAELSEHGAEEDHEALVERRPRDRRRRPAQRLVAQPPPLEQHRRRLLRLQPERRADAWLFGRVDEDVDLERLRDVLPPRLQLVVHRQKLLRLDVEPAVDAAAPEHCGKRLQAAVQHELRRLLDAVADDELQLLRVVQLLALLRHGHRRPRRSRAALSDPPDALRWSFASRDSLAPNRASAPSSTDRQQDGPRRGRCAACLLCEHETETFYDHSAYPTQQLWAHRQHVECRHEALLSQARARANYLQARPSASLSIPCVQRVRHGWPQRAPSAM